MDKFGLIDAIRSYCIANSYIFIYGNEAYANALSDSQSYAPNQLIIVADFTCIPTLENSTVTELRYNGVLMVGQKCENTTSSNLDETPIQKYDRRLKSLSALMMEIIGDLTCANELEATGINIKYDLNKFDLNADFIAATLTFIQ